MSELAGVVAVLACTLFAGAALYINLVEHPARLSCGTAIAATQWAPSYSRGAVMQASLAILATLAGLGQWLQSGDVRWGWGSLAIFVVVPFTLTVVFPTNSKLLEPGRDPASEETRELLEAWGRLHAVRTAFSLCASLIFAWALSGARSVYSLYIRGGDADQGTEEVGQQSGRPHSAIICGRSARGSGFDRRHLRGEGKPEDPARAATEFAERPR